MTRRAPALLAVCAALAVALALELGRRADRTGIAEPPVPPPAARSPVLARRTSDSPAQPGPPRWLAGTDSDGRIEIDAHGHFVPTREALRWLDYRVLAAGAAPLGATERAIAAELGRTLEPPARQEALEFLGHYVRLRQKSIDILDGKTGARSQREGFEQLRAARRAELGETLARELYADEDALMLLELDKQDLLGDPSLDADERARRIAALEDRLPQALYEARAAMRAPARLREEVAALRARGASDAEIFEARARATDRDAAERLAALDQKRAAFARALAGYLPERDALLADDSRSLAERESALESLRRARFDEADLPRVRALDEDAADSH